MDLSGEGIDAICIVYLDHQSVAPIRFAVRRLRKKFANVPIAICLWGATDLTAKADDARADATLQSLQEAIEFCRSSEGTPKLTDTTGALPGSGSSRLRLNERGMEANLSALERAFQLARSGQVTNVKDIKAQLKREGYDLGQITGSVLIRQLQRIIKAARNNPC